MVLSEIQSVYAFIIKAYCIDNAGTGAVVKGPQNPLAIVATQNDEALTNTFEIISHVSNYVLLFERGRE